MTMEQKVRLLLIDDHTLFREGLARLLEAEEGLEVVGHFSSTGEAINAAELNSVHVVLLDFDLGEEQGLQFIRESHDRGFQGKILMVTAGMSDADSLAALESGAAGIFLKHNPPANLITAIYRVAGGELWLDTSSLDILLNAASNKAKPKTALKLSHREQAALKGVFEGLTNKEIAAELAISESYVKAVLQQLFAKTGVRTRSQLVRVALEKRIEYSGALNLELQRKVV
jgi:DNA-binding NarL/FixJ family response regulator